MPTRIGLMGFGRIGRNIFRILYKRDDLRVEAISDIADHKALEYLLRFDTVLGRFPDEVSIKDGHLYCRGRRTAMLSGREPGDVPWRDLGVDVVVEATAHYRSREEVARHLEAGAKRVILCVPPRDEPDISVVMGVNDHLLGPQHRIVSNSSCTAHCAAPILKILHEAFGLRRALFTTVHAYTNQDRLADVPHGDLRRGRAAAENIIPTPTNAAHLVAQLIPDLKGRIAGLAVNVPVPDGSLVDLVAWTEKKVDTVSINEVVRTAAAGPLHGIVEYEEDPIVSSDVIGNPHSSIFDALSTMTLGDNLMKAVAWYDNGWGYANRVVDLIERLAAMEGAR
jgi:glyceraldehyde 3-phosphate dehydrogenase